MYAKCISDFLCEICAYGKDPTADTEFDGARAPPSGRLDFRSQNCSPVVFSMPTRVLFRAVMLVFDQLPMKLSQ